MVSAELQQLELAHAPEALKLWKQGNLKIFWEQKTSVPCLTLLKLSKAVKF